MQEACLVPGSAGKRTGYMQSLRGRRADRQRGVLGASNAAGALREKRGSYGPLGGPVEVTRPASRHSRCKPSVVLSGIERHERRQLLCVVVWRGVKHAKATFGEASCEDLLFAQTCV